MSSNTFATTRVLVLGAAGMLGNTVLRYLAGRPGIEVTGSVRSTASLRLLPESVRGHVVSGVDVENADVLSGLLAETRPNVVINCVGLVKQLSAANDPLVALPLNALFPHRLSRLCVLGGSRVIHVSTDCVFSGAKGMYSESDSSDAKDLYGRSKFLGELDAPHAVTLRTSIIGHELSGSNGLVGWFLSQQDAVKGFSGAIFSGLPTVELARVMHEFVLPRPELRGVYHVAAERISKLELLRLIAAAYGRTTTIVPDATLQIDRSLDGTRFRDATGYLAPAWPELVRRMHDFH